MAQEITKIAVFKGKDVRRILVNDVWWFSVVDICGALTDSLAPGAYWRKLKQRLTEEAQQPVTFCHGLKLPAPDGKLRETDCASTEGVFRLIQSIPSPKAEPFKRWLARVGKERLDEIENPELGMQRTAAIYEKKGYPKEWIEKRLRGIAVRKKLTDEWDVRGAENDNDYAILTNEIMLGAFEFTVAGHKKHKGLKKENLRDHMTDLELIIAMLGEAATTHITQDRDSCHMPALQKDAKDGGAIAGRTRKDIEYHTGAKVVSQKNFLSGKKERI
ncbi:MAG: Bro-N domain-containing protein [Candidatus Omnitrophica bacterium]|nr:Bro-N domain-containing protein [Candidatus Omnitrophota bacterium]